MDDRQIVAAVRAGDRRAIAALYDRYAHRLHDYARRRCEVAADAADVVHDAFLVAVERIGQLRDPDRLRTWLFAITRTELHRRYRSPVQLGAEPGFGVGSGSGSGDWREPASPAPGPDALAEQAELAALLREAASGLSDSDRDLLDLHLRHGLVGADLAAAAGMPPRHASVALDRVKQRFVRALGVVLLARRPVCAEFAALRRTNPTLTPLSRKRLARHIDSCQQCRAEQSRRLRPEALLGALPLLPAPPGLRERALRLTASGDAVAHAATLRWDADGFPRQRAARHRRGWVAAAAVMVLASTAGLLVVLDFGSADPAAGRPQAPASTPPSPSTSASASTSTGEPTSGPPGPPTTSRPTTTTAAPTPTEPPDTRPPTIGAPTMEPTIIATQLGTGPSCTNLPTTATVHFTVVDVTRTTVTLTWSWPGTEPSPTVVSADGHSHEATIGPVPDAAVPDGDHPLTVTITATDASGHKSTRTAEVGTLRACGVIG